MQDFHDGLFGPDLVKDDDNDKQLDKPLFQLAREGDIESMQAVLSRYSVGFILFVTVFGTSYKLVVWNFVFQNHIYKVLSKIE